MTYPNNPLQPTSQRRLRILELAAQLYRDREANPALASVVELLSLELEDCKDDILKADVQTFSALKGEAGAYQNLLKHITVARPSVPKE